MLNLAHDLHLAHDLRQLLGPSACAYRATGIEIALTKKYVESL
jgi:hypothetical protein